MTVITKAISEDQVLAERTVTDAAHYLRDGMNYLPKYRNRWRKQMTNELAYLRESHPDSKVLKMDFSDISLVLEKE